jgi:hypothetical protein
MTDLYSTTPGSQRTTSNEEVSSQLSQAVSEWIKKNPDAYKKAQDYGEFLMSSRFANVDKFKIDQDDKEGDIILYNQLLNKIEYYGLQIDELNDFEINVLKKINNNWRSLFNNQDNAMN